MRGAIVLLAGLALAGSADAAPPLVTATATPAAGVAPVRVTLTAAGDAVSYAWSLGDGATAEGAVVTHVYGAGAFVATVTATSSTGEVAQAQVTVTPVRRTVSLEAPRSSGYGEPAVLAGSLRPARAERACRSTAAGLRDVRAGGRDGRFRTRLLLRSPGPYHVRYGAARSTARVIRLRPRIEATLPPAVPIGSRLTLRSRLVPAGAGSVSARVLFDGRQVAARAGSLRLPTGRPGTLRVELTRRPRPGYAPVRRVLSAQVVVPSLAAGARGPSVLALERRLAELHYALRGVDSVYGQDTFEAVLAFQKVHGLPRTGRVESWLWRRLSLAGIPRARYGGDYIEVDKTRQVLFVVARRRGVTSRPRLHRSHRQHAARQLAGLPQGRRVGLGAVVSDVLQGRLRDPRLSVRARLSRVARLRPDPDVDRPVALQHARLRHDGRGTPLR